MNTIIRYSQDGLHVEGWHAGQLVTRAPVAAGGAHEAMGHCLDHLRRTTGTEPVLDPALKAELARLDALFCRLAYAGEWR